MAGFCLKPRKLLNNLSYPVKEIAFYRNIVEDNDINLSDFEHVSRFIYQKLSIPYNRNIDETILCESIEGGRECMWDILPMGCDAFWIDDYGKAWIRLYDKYSWK